MSLISIIQTRACLLKRKKIQSELVPIWADLFTWVHDLFTLRISPLSYLYHLLFSGFLDKYHIGSDTLRFYCKLLQQKNICYWLHWSQCYSPTGKHVTLRILRPKNDCIMFDFTMSNSKIRLKIVQYKPGLTWGFVMLIIMECCTWHLCLCGLPFLQV